MKFTIRRHKNSILYKMKKSTMTLQDWLMATEGFRAEVMFCPNHSENMVMNGLIKFSWRIRAYENQDKNVF
ncbi:hypothetical protein JCM16418A_37960 [Paenibacillus pini]